MSIAVRLEDEANERAAMSTLGLCDLSALKKLGLKGRDAETWLTNEGIDLPPEIYQSRTLADDGVVVRLGSDEFFLESGIKSEVVPALMAHLRSVREQVAIVPREDATFALTGAKAIDVFSQTCAVDFSKAIATHLTMTRVAGVSCGVFPFLISEIPAYRLWVDPSYAVYLWETLVEICESLSGCVVGAGCIYS